VKDLLCESIRAVVIKPRHHRKLRRDARAWLNFFVDLEARRAKEGRPLSVRLYTYEERVERGVLDDVNLRARD
jgi:hypothetical protein